MIGLEPGATARTHIPAEQAYGPMVEELRISVERSQFPAGLEVQLGDQLQMQTQDGQTIPVEVVELADESVVVDANHPLAGKALTFEIELVEVA